MEPKDLLIYHKDRIHESIKSDFYLSLDLIEFDFESSNNFEFGFVFGEFLKIKEIKNPILANPNWKSSYECFVEVKVYHENLVKPFLWECKIELSIGTNECKFTVINPIYGVYSDFLDQKLRIINVKFGGLLNYGLYRTSFDSSEAVLDRIYLLMNLNKIKINYKPLEFEMDFAFLQNELMFKISECILLKPQLQDFTYKEGEFYGKPIYGFKPNLTESNYYSSLSSIYQIQYAISERIAVLLNNHLGLFNKNKNFSLIKVIDKLKIDGLIDNENPLVIIHKKIHNAFNENRRIFVHHRGLESEINFNLLMTLGNIDERINLKVRAGNLHEQALLFPKYNMQLLDEALKFIEGLEVKY